MTTFPEFLRFRAGLLSDARGLPGLLAPPTPPPPRPAPPQPPAQSGGLGSVLGTIFGGADDPNLTPEQNQAARRQALIQAGLGILASEKRGLGAVAEGGLYGQMAGQQARASIYGRTQQERIANALQDPELMASIPENIRKVLPYLPPEQALKIIVDASGGEVKLAKPGDYLIQGGKTIGQVPAAPDDALKGTSSYIQDAMFQLGFDPSTPLTAEQRVQVSTVARQLRDASALKIGAQGQQDFSNLGQLSTAFQRDISDAQTVANSYGTILAAAKDPSPAGDLALLTAYMKALDPGSTVREGEFANAQNAGSVPERIRALYNKTIEGTRLTEEQRNDFVDRARRIAGQRKTQLQPILRRYEKRAKAVGLDPTLVIFDPFAEVGLGETPAGSASWGSK